MERLTERFSNGQAAVYGCGNNCKYDFKYCENHLEDCPTINEIYEKLATYEDLEEQGKLLRLPCAVGDRIYGIQMFSGGGRVHDWGEVYEGEFILEAYEEFGKTVFLTKPEAEAVLQKMNENKR